MRKSKFFKGIYDRYLGPFIPRSLKRAILSGLCGALASTLGKFALGDTELVETCWKHCVDKNLMGGVHECSAIITVIRLAFFILLLFANGAMLFNFLEAMKKNSTLTVTVVSSAANYLTSGIAGLLIFGEPVGSYWLVGSLGICVGIAVIGYSQEDRSHPSKGKKDTPPRSGAHSTGAPAE